MPMFDDMIIMNSYWRNKRKARETCYKCGKAGCDEESSVPMCTSCYFPSVFPSNSNRDKEEDDYDSIRWGY